MREIEEKIGYRFKNPDYLEKALTHSSYANEHNSESNERLEFLGDSVLSLIVSENLFSRLKRDDEGDLSKIRASLVCEKGLFELSKEIDLPAFIRLGKGEESTGGRSRASVVSDAFEALLAAIFLDSDYDTAKKWLLKIMEKELSLAGDRPSDDYKTIIQEVTQKGNKGKVSYELISESGPAHEKKFVVAVLIDGVKVAEGFGLSKKDAEQMAAHNALELL